MPLNWAGIQNNLGNALARLGERETSTTQLEEAVGAYRAALSEWTRERVPLNWAMTQTNLGTALLRLGERKKSAALLCDALARHVAAWEVFAPHRHPYADTAKQGGARDIATLKEHFEPSTYQDCLERHKPLLQQMYPAEQRS